jgi:hypothetical protein
VTDDEPRSGDSPDDWLWLAAQWHTVAVQALQRASECEDGARRRMLATWPLYVGIIERRILDACRARDDERACAVESMRCSCGRTSARR